MDKSCVHVHIVGNTRETAGMGQIEDGKHVLCDFGLNYDPSHFVWQGMDYIQPIYEFQDKMFHIHFKDIKIHKDKLAECGIMDYPLDYIQPKIPGLGDVNWGAFVSALTDIGYDGYACVEVEDRAFEGSREKVEKSLSQSRKYLEQFV